MRLLRDGTGAMALTVSHMFIGAVSIGIAFFRGTEVNAAFHHETTLAHASYGASKLAMDHARAANVVVNDNVAMGAIMGPRFGVEADNITMDLNAAVACPTCPNSPTCTVCAQYQANKPRAMAKLIWVRAQQQLLWGTLGKLSGDIDKLAFLQASGLVKGDIAKADAKVAMRFEDPSLAGEIWGGGNADVACTLAMKDTLPSPVTGHAFQVGLITPNLLEGMPQALVISMPSVMCKATSAMSNAGRGGSLPEDQPKLGAIKEVADQARKECDELEDQVRCAVSPGACGASTEAQILDRSDVRGSVTLPSKAQELVTCSSASPGSPPGQSGAGYFYRNRSGGLTTCTFDRAKCREKKLGESSDDFLRSKLGLPKIVANLAQSLGGSETRKPSDGAKSNPPRFCACAVSSKPVDETMIGISDAARKIASMGSAEPSQALRKKREYTSCGRWYFPKRKGEFAMTPEDEMPFVAAWKWNETTRCQP